MEKIQSTTFSLTPVDDWNIINDTIIFNSSDFYFLTKIISKFSELNWKISTLCVFVDMPSSMIEDGLTFHFNKESYYFIINYNNLSDPDHIIHIVEVDNPPAAGTNRSSRIIYSVKLCDLLKFEL